MKTTPRKIAVLVAIASLCMTAYPAGSQPAPPVDQLPVQSAPPAQEVSPLTRHVFDSANQALSVTEKTANQTLGVAQAAIKAAETTMNEVRNAHTSLLQYLLAVITIFTAAAGVLGFKTLPAKVKAVAKEHATAVLAPELEKLQSSLKLLSEVNTQQDVTITAQNQELARLRENLLGLREEWSHELTTAREKAVAQSASLEAEHKTFAEYARTNMLSLTQGCYGAILGMRAESPGLNSEEAVTLWAESARWYELAAQNAGNLENSIQRWLWLNLAFAQKRCNCLPLALESAEKACELGPSCPMSHYNAACYAALCNQKDKLLRYLEKALKLDRSDAQKIIPAPGNSESGEPDMRAYWADEALLALVGRFMPQAV